MWFVEGLAWDRAPAPPFGGGDLLCVNTCSLGLRKPTARGILTLRLVAPGVARRRALLFAIQVWGVCQSAKSCLPMYLDDYALLSHWCHTAVARSVCYVDVWAV